MTLEEIVNSLKSAGQDYGQLFNNNPKYTAVASNVTKGLENLVPPQFTNTQDAKSQEYSKKLAEWALGNGMGMSGMALTFIGKNAANWNPVKAAEAEKMLNAGVDPAQVWKQHLIGRMPDKSLFSEIDDSKQATQGLNMLTRALEPEAIAQGAPRTMPSWVWMDHPELFDNYPHTGNTMINPTSSIESQGSFDPMSNILNLSAFSKDPKSTTLHEFQHAIQEKEGWARGGSPEQMREEALAMLRRDVASGEIPSTEQAMAMLPMAQQNAYRRLTGEAQARATQDRMNMNMQQRRDTYPLAGGKLSDIPLDQLINRYR